MSYGETKEEIVEEEKFEIVCWFENYEGGLSPFVLQITKNELIISARFREDKAPYSSSLNIIKSIDEFLHRISQHKDPKECKEIERIRFPLF